MPSGTVETTASFVSPGIGAKNISSISKKSSKGLPLLCLTTGKGATISPFVKGLMKRFFFINSGLTWRIIPFSAGARTTLFASFTFAFLTLIISPTPIPAFLLVIPSILIIFRPMSTG